MAKITVIGAGVMGSTITFPARDNFHDVSVVGTPFDKQIIESLKKDGMHPGLKRKLPDGIKFFQFEDAEKELKGNDLIIAGISSFGAQWFADEVIPMIEENTPVLIVTKGLYSRGNGDFCSFVEFFEEKSGGKVPFFAIGGPCISYELADRHNTFVGICGYDEKQLLKIKEWLTTDYYHINTTTDVFGFEIASAVKNIYALAVSMATGVAEAKEGIGCRPHYNAQSGLFAQSIREMELLITGFGGKSENIVYGVSDLYITIESGRNREIGVLLGRGMRIEKALEELKGMTLESISAVKSLSEALFKKSEKGEFDLNKIPLFMHVYDLVSGKKTVDIPWQMF